MTGNTDMNYQLDFTPPPQEFKLLTGTSEISSVKQFDKLAMVEGGGLVVAPSGNNSPQTYVNTAVTTLEPTLKQLHMQNIATQNIQLQNIYSKHLYGNNDVTASNPSQLYAHVPENTDVHMPGAATTSPAEGAAVGETNSGGSGSRSFSFISRFAEYEVDGLGPPPPSYTLPQQQLNHDNEKAFLLLQGPESTPNLGGNQFPKKEDILESAVAAIDSEFLGGGGGLDFLEQVNDVDTIPNLDTNEIILLLKDTGEPPVADAEGSSLVDSSTSQFDVSHLDDTIVTTTVDDESPIAATAKKRKKKTREDGDEKQETTRKTKPPPTKKQRLWQIEKPFEDKDMERKRQDAIRAKKNRDRSKTGKKTLEKELDEVKRTRDELRKEVMELKAKLAALELVVQRRYTPRVENANIQGREAILVSVKYNSSDCTGDSSSDADHHYTQKQDDGNNQVAHIMNVFGTVKM